MFTEIEIQCPFCFEQQTAFLDPQADSSETQVIDCSVCCHPMDIRVSVDEETGAVQASVERSGGF